MAGGKPVDLDGYRLIVKPLSWWRRLTRDFWPYWQGGKPRFLMEVTRIGPPAGEATITWFIRFANAQVTYGQAIVPPLRSNDTTRLEIGDKFLGYTGDTLLVVPTNLSSTRPEPYHTLYTFHTTPKVWVSLAILAGLLAGLLGSLLQYLFSL